MSVIVRKCIVSLSRLTLNHFNSLPTLFFSSSSSLEVSSTISHLINPHRTDSIISCLNQTGFSSTQINHMIKKYPQTLNISPEILKAKLNIFHDNKFSTSDTIDIISRYPSILNLRSEIRIGTSIAALKSVLGSTEAVCRVLKKLSWFLKTDLEKTMIPNIKYLTKSCNLSCSEVTDQIFSFPMIFLLRPETLMEGARRVGEMGLQWTPKMYLYAVGVVCSLSPETFQLKKNIFFQFGFSDLKVLTMFNQCPSVFSSSVTKIEKTMQVLLSSGRIDRSSLATMYAQLLRFSLEKRIKPRLEVMDAIEERGLLLKKLSLSTMMTISNKKFLERYVISNSKALGYDFVTGITNRCGKSCKLFDRS